MIRNILKIFAGIISTTCLFASAYGEEMSQLVEFTCSRDNDMFMIKATTTYDRSKKSNAKDYVPSQFPSAKFGVNQTPARANLFIDRSCKLKSKEIQVKVVYGEPRMSGPDSGTPGAILNLSINGVETLKQITFDRPCYACTSVSRVGYIKERLEICGTYQNETRCTFLENGDLSVPVQDLFLFQNLFWK